MSHDQHDLPNHAPTRRNRSASRNPLSITLVIAAFVAAAGCEPSSDADRAPASTARASNGRATAGHDAPFNGRHTARGSTFDGVNLHTEPPGDVTAPDTPIISNERSAGDDWTASTDGYNDDYFASIDSAADPQAALESALRAFATDVAEWAVKVTDLKAQVQRKSDEDLSAMMRSTEAKLLDIQTTLDKAMLGDAEATALVKADGRAWLTDLKERYKATNAKLVALDGNPQLPPA